ncbi:MAG: hypothetical protein U1F58_11330 [Burkholderiales bacterium]
MVKRFATPQEAFWAGEFGTEYGRRNTGAGILASNVHLFSKILEHAPGVTSVLELGANIGLNLHAIRSLLPDVELDAVELNKSAAEELARWGHARVHVQSLLEFRAHRQWDMTLSKGVLIHVAPDQLGKAYDLLHAAAKTYICICEYYSRSPVTVSYRGHGDVLFKRDFAGDMLDRFPDLRLVACGFEYHRASVFPMDDVTWFLLRKQ